MKVRALRLGYYGDKRRREDAVFFLKDKSHFSEKWMEVIEENAKPKRKKAASPKKVESKEVDSNAEVI